AVEKQPGNQHLPQLPPQHPVLVLRFWGLSHLAGTPQIQQVYSAMNPLLAYTLAPMHLSAFDIPRGSGKTTWERGFFFLTAPLAITSYHTSKTRLAEAPFGPAGDDNGPGSEPPPRDRTGIATAFVPSRRWSPAAP
ncbi:hypothetical protein THAOC_22183, partial [Thalassiosira oceanica]